MMLADPCVAMLYRNFALKILEAVRLVSGFWILGGFPEIYNNILMTEFIRGS